MHVGFLAKRGRGKGTKDQFYQMLATMLKQVVFGGGRGKEKGKDLPPIYFKEAWLAGRTFYPHNFS